MVVAGANVHDTKLLRPTLESIVVERPEGAQNLCLDKGYDNPTGHGAVADAGYQPQIRRIGEEKLDQSGEEDHPARRWVVERTLGWLSKCRAILVRYDKKPSNYLGLLQLACERPREATAARTRLNQTRWLDVPRSACLTTGDRVIQEGNRIWVPCDNGMCQILPSYAYPASLKLGGLRLNVVVKEITDADEYAAYEHLADLHYRGHVVHGRTARLIVRTIDPAYPKVVGFIELATPFFMNKPRSRVLDTPFDDERCSMGILGYRYP